MQESIQKLLAEIGTMLPLYQAKAASAVQAAAKNVEWNAKKLRGEAGIGFLDLDTWARYTAGDFETIAKGMSEGEPGQVFAANFGERLHTAFGGAGLNDPLQPAATAASTPDGSAPAEVGAASAPASTDFDLNTVLEEKAKAAGEKLDWNRSVVDLLKLLGLDSSMEGRRKAGASLGMTDSEIASIGSEAGNTALHSKLLGRLAQTRGALPEGLA